MIDEMLARLAAVKRSNIDFPGGHAAVLCLLYPCGNDLNIVLTLRSSTMRSHAGDVSFPGGRVDDTDANLVATARREAYEEINFPQEYHLRIIAQWPPYLSKNNLLVHPIIAYSPVDPRPQWTPVSNPAEVDEIFTVKVSQLVNGEGYSGKWMKWYSTSWKMHKFELQGEALTPSTGIKRIWGLTARICIDIARTATGQTPPYDYTDEIGDLSRIEKAIDDGVFGTQSAVDEETKRQRSVEAEESGEGRIDILHKERRRGNI